MAVYNVRGEEEKSRKELLNDDGRQQKFKKNRSISKPWMTYSLAICNILLIIVLMTVVVIWRLVSGHANHTGDVSLQDVTCLKCEDIGVNKDGYAKNVRIHVDDDGTWVCCAEVSHHLDRLIDQHVEKIYQLQKMYGYVTSDDHDANDAQARRNQKPTARVVGVAKTSPGTIQEDTLRWERDSTQSFVHSNITYKDGRFTVRRPGLFYVYTQISFKDSNDTATLFHLVYRHNARTSVDEKLMESVKPHCKFQTSDCKIASYVGAVFDLNADDEIYVLCSNPSRIIKSQVDNYFGLHLI